MGRFNRCARDLTLCTTFYETFQDLASLLVFFLITSFNEQQERVSDQARPPSNLSHHPTVDLLLLRGGKLQRQRQPYAHRMMRADIAFNDTLPRRPRALVHAQFPVYGQRITTVQMNVADKIFNRAYEFFQEGIYILILAALLNLLDSYTRRKKLCLDFINK